MDSVDSQIVNEAMISQINTLPGLQLPNDAGIGAGKKISAIGYVAETGDIANREENGYQAAAVSWKQFTEDYGHKLTIQNKEGKPAELLLVPGNHDASDAIGFYRPMVPPTDATSMAGIYNLMLHPSVAKTKDTYNYATDKINYSKNIGGIHFVFLTIWADSANRVWLANDLKNIPSSTPVMLFMHDPPEADSKHFTNPNGQHDINGADKFENLLTEQFKDGNTQGTVMEQKGFVVFLKAHPNIKAFFHGHSNYKEFYIYKGPDNDIALPCFRSDSPMKGKYSAVDETKLSFQLVTINTDTKKMTVRECLWNTDPANAAAPIVWGDHMTISLQ